MAHRLPSPNFGPRPEGAIVDLLVLHSISLPPGIYGGDEVQRLFTNRLDPLEHPVVRAIARFGGVRAFFHPTRWRLVAIRQL
jgi:AmpD protein